MLQISRELLYSDVGRLFNRVKEQLFDAGDAMNMGRSNMNSCLDVVAVADELKNHNVSLQSSLYPSPTVSYMHSNRRSSDTKQIIVYLDMKVWLECIIKSAGCSDIANTYGSENGLWSDCSRVEDSNYRQSHHSSKGISLKRRKKATVACFGNSAVCLEDGSSLIVHRSVMRSARIR